jgi:hypothetical protein
LAETPSKTQLPLSHAEAGLPGAGENAEEEAQAFQRGLEIGREYAEIAVRRIGAWAEEHPGQVLLAGLGAGILLGKLLFPRRRAVSEDSED